MKIPRIRRFIAFKNFNFRTALRGIIIILAIYGFITLWQRLFSKSTSSWYTPVDQPLDLQLYNNQRIVHVVEDVHNVDHCVLYNFSSRTAKQNNVKYEPISLALHSSVNYASHIVKQASTWDDLISYAIYIMPGHEAALPLVSQLHHCHSLTKSKVSIHLVWKRGLFQRECAVDSTLVSIKSVLKQKVSCKNFSVDAVAEKLQQFTLGLTSYPINVMRNEARRGATTKLHLVGDMETRWSIGFARNIRNLTSKLLNNDYGSAVLVYRRFEQDAKSEFPNDIETFARLITERKILLFHQKYYYIAHIIPNFNKWINYSLKHDTVLVHNITYWTHLFEPQFIMRYDAPYHYEHTPTRYLDHQFLCYELCRAGYSFLLMTHVFNIHPGIKTHNSAYEQAVGAFANANAAPILKNFGAYLNATYPISPNSTRRCPMWI